MSATLTNAQLIELLKTLPPDAKVYWPHFEEGFCGVGGAGLFTEEDIKVYQDKSLLGHICLEQSED